MKKIFTVLFALLMGAHVFTTSASASIVNTPVDASEYITIGGADWAWAGPCSAFAPTCGAIDLSLQGSLGWAVASTAQIDAVVLAIGGLAAWVAQFEPGDICASRFFSNDHNHCDYPDGSAGYIFNFSGNSLPGEAYLETFAIRVSAVPVPAAGFLLLGGIGMLAANKRRKKISS